MHFLEKKIEVKNYHFTILNKIRSMRFLIYGMAVLDFALFSTHELLHHNFFFNENIINQPAEEEVPLLRRMLAKILRDEKI